jgi:beta-mannanase
MTPMVSWNLSLADGTVTLGGHDGYLWQQADAVAAFKGPVFVRLDWEMNATWYPQWNLPAVTPSAYIAAWRHVYAIFQKANATNGCPNLWTGPGGTRASAWYPGDAYVDWIGVDAYPQAAPENTLLNLPDGLEDTVRNAAAHHKPLMIAEWAPNLPEPDTAAAMELIPQFAARYPKTVKALVYFDFSGGGKDYTLAEHPVGAAALRRLIDGDPHYLTTVVGAG